MAIAKGILHLRVEELPSGGCIAECIVADGGGMVGLLIMEGLNSPRWESGAYVFSIGHSVWSADQ